MHGRSKMNLHLKWTCLIEFLFLGENKKNSFWFHTHSRNVQCVVRRGGEFGSGRKSEFGNTSLWVVKDRIGACVLCCQVTRMLAIGAAHEAEESRTDNGCYAVRQHEKNTRKVL